MMKEVCAQCLQPQIDPVTGERTVVFSCFNQDQALDRVDFPALHERLTQNGAQEKLATQWHSHQGVKQGNWTVAPNWAMVGNREAVYARAGAAREQYFDNHVHWSCQTKREAPIATATTVLTRIFLPHAA